MIPLRNFPYSDYHDLNLDYLLSTYGSLQSDLDALDARVTALENWRGLAEPDIASLKTRMSTVEGQITAISGRLTTAESNITSLGSRVTTAETNINVLAGNPVKYFISFDDQDNLIVRKNSRTATPLSDLTDFFKDLMQVSTTTKGVKTVEVYWFALVEIRNLHFDCSLSSDGNGTVTFYYYYAFTTISLVKTKLTVSAFTITDIERTYKAGNLTLNAAVSITSGNCVANDDPELSTDYPYKYVFNNDYIESTSMVNVFFNTSSDFMDYSDKICQYVKTDTHKCEIYLTEALTVSLSAYITGG